MIIWTVVICTFIFSPFVGFIEACLFDYKASSTKANDGRNIHWAFDLVRAAFGVVCAVAMLLILPAIKAVLVSISLFCFFPWLHDGMYYFIRHRLDQSIYPKGWLDEKHPAAGETGRALIDLTNKQRNILMGVGIFIFLLAIKWQKLSSLF